MARVSVRAPARRVSSILVVAAIVAATAMGGLTLSLGSSTDAGADPIGSCSTTTGVIVAVNFSSWGGDVERGCDATLTTGYDALQAAGFTTAGDAHDGPAFICRIDNEPTPAEDPCIDTPPVTAYWSYWHADAGQNTWSYSQEGAMSYHPLAGSVDAWTFGSTAGGGTDGEPPFPPSAVRATNTSVVASAPSPTTTTTTREATPAPTTTRPPSATKAAAAVGPGGHSSGSPTAGAAPTVDATSTTTTTIAPKTSTSTSTKRPPSTTTTKLAPTALPSTRGRSTPKIVDAAPASIDHQPTGSAVPVIVGAVVIAALASIAGAAAWRRRRTD